MLVRRVVVRSENGQTARLSSGYISAVSLDPDTCYRALSSRDGRFDGVFFVGVETTGVYCRPICPARTPGRTRCVFFVRAAEAERAGFRACFRCRPELAPGLASVDSVSRLAARAAEHIDAGYLNDHGVDDLAGMLGVSARHLRRALESELGVAPIELAQTRRLAMAKQLLADTRLPLAEVAFASGFSSVRRFNAAVRERFGRPASALRGAAPADDGAIPLRLDFRPPFDFAATLSFLRARAIPGVEHVDQHEYTRSVCIDGVVGAVSVRPHPTRSALVARVSPSLTSKLMPVAQRLRALFDLDARPQQIAAHLRRDALLAPLVKRYRGLRIAGAFSGFETAVRVILGQQVSVAAATTLSGRLAERFGAASGLERVARIFPEAEVLAGARVAQVRAVGVTEARARTIVALSRAVASGRIDLAHGEPEQLVAELLELPGIGPWSAHAIALRALSWPDAFPGGDLVLRRALGADNARARGAARGGLGSLACLRRDALVARERRRRNMMLSHTVVRTPIGDVKLVANDRALVAVVLPGQQKPFDSVAAEGHAVLKRAAEELQEYFAGRRDHFDVELEPRGTPFQRRVWAELAKIPFGERRSYGQLAAALGKPGAARAVGRANATNPIAILLPCHRVIGADGSLTGFAGGLGAKRWLLAHEGSSDGLRS